MCQTVGRWVNGSTTFTKEARSQHRIPNSLPIIEGGLGTGKERWQKLTSHLTSKWTPPDGAPCPASSTRLPPSGYPGERPGEGGVGGSRGVSYSGALSNQNGGKKTPGGSQDGIFSCNLVHTTVTRGR